MEKSKIALVTGGSRGLGKDMAVKLAKKGLNIVLTYHSQKEEAQEVVETIQALGQKAFAIQLDVSKTATFDAFITKLTTHLYEKEGSKNIDYLINNAGTGLYKTITDTTEEDFDDMLNIHFKGVYFLTQKMLPYLNDGGGIVNISSGLARYSFVASSAYACMKGAIEVFTKYLAKELGARKIRANVVAPGAVATDFGGGANRDNAERRQTIANATALGRVGETDDIGGIVAFLCSEDAKWVNGQRIEVTGGMLL